MQDTSTIELIEPRRMLVRLRGKLEVEDVRLVDENLLPRLREIGPRGEVIVDLHELVSCTTAARMQLAHMQRKIADLEARTAFIADRPRFRGIGLFVAHTSDDPNARAFHQLAQAQAWLESKEGRVASITAYLTRVTRGRPSKRSRRSSEDRRLRRSSEELRRRVAKLRDSDDSGGRR